MISNDFLVLIERCKQKDEEALEQCFLQNSGLVWSLVHRFHYSKQDPNDLFQIGCIGLMKAIMNFDPTYQVMFSTYAVPMILGEIKKYFRESGDMRISRSIKERYLQIMKFNEQFQQIYSKEAKVDDIAKALDLSEDEVIMALEANQYMISLDEPYQLKDGSSVRLEDRIESKQLDIIEYISLAKEIEKLNDLEKKILYYRYELSMNQQDIANILQISQVQVSRLEKKILLKLREMLL